jgi:hypothetical protein
VLNHNDEVPRLEDFPVLQEFKDMFLEEDHEEHLALVLKMFREHKLYAKLSSLKFIKIMSII